MVSNQLDARYARAIFESAGLPARQARVAGELDRVEGLTRELPALGQILYSPVVLPAVKQAMIQSLLASQADALTVDALFLLTDKRRERRLAGIVDALKALIRDRDNIAQVQVTSALPLSPEDVDALRDRLARVLNKTVELATTVDERLLGGIVIRIGDRLIDGSCRGQLETLRTLLTM